MTIRTLVVDDTVLYRKILTEAARHFEELEVIGAAASGSIALKKLAVTPADLILLDIHMPDMDGIETLRRIRASYPDSLVIMVSGISDRAAQSTIQALQIGAIDFIQKPAGANPQESMGQLTAEMKPMVRLVKTRMLSRSASSGMSVKRSAPPPRADVRPAAAPARFAVCAIGVSTGGPEALGKLIPSLPADLSVPIVLVQHMPPGFTRSLAESLDRKSAARVTEARDGEILEPGSVYIAPGGRHMTVRRADNQIQIGLNDGPPENSCRPSVDVLFRSVAAAYGERGVLAAILTGMGSDGLAGVRTLKRRGCFCITQCAESCVVYGMPRAVDEQHLSDLSIPVEQIGPAITDRIRGRAAAPIG
jgi:two-component system chemotaxis response regulator CheB